MELLNDELYQEFIKEGKCIIDVFMEPCPYCVEYASIFEEVSKEYPDLKFASILINDSSKFKGEFFKVQAGVKVSFPTTLILENGNLITRHAGRLFKDQLEKFLDTGEVPVPDNKQQIVNIKAAVYDQMVIIENAQMRIKQLNEQLISKKDH